NRVRLCYGSQVRFPGFYQTDCCISLRFRYMYERAIYMVNSFQFTRSSQALPGVPKSPSRKGYFVSLSLGFQGAPWLELEWMAMKPVFALVFAAVAALPGA